jgi:hypothetical protein
MSSNILPEDAVPRTRGIPCHDLLLKFNPLEIFFLRDVDHGGKRRGCDYYACPERGLEK